MVAILYACLVINTLVVTRSIVMKCVAPGQRMRVYADISQLDRSVESLILLCVFAPMVLAIIFGCIAVIMFFGG